MFDNRFPVSFFTKSKISIIFVVIPSLILVVLISVFGVNVIIGDEWAIVPYFEKLFEKKISIEDLFSPHNEHIIFFPKIVMLFNALVFKYNSKLQMFLGLFFIFLNFLLISKKLYELLEKDFNISHLILPSFAIFTMRQWENLLYGWQFQIPMAVFFVLFSFYCLSYIEKSNIYFLLAIVSSIIASFSFGNGILVWFIGLFIIYSKIGFKKEFFIWLIFSIIIIIFYFNVYVESLSSSNSSLYRSRNVINIIIYFITSTGSSLTTEKYSAFVIGILLISLYFYSLKNYKEYIFWNSIIIFVIVSLFIVAISRSGFGWQSAIASRYVSFSILLPVSIYSIFLHRSYLGEGKNIFRLIIMLFFIQIITSFANYFKYEIVYNENKIEENILKNYKQKTNKDLMPDLSKIEYLKEINPKLYNKIYDDFLKAGDIKKNGCAILEKYHLSIFKS